MPAPKTALNQQGEQVISVGFSGTRLGMSQLQLDILRKSLEGKTGEFHHGDCIGADAEAHDMLRREFPDKWRIIIHPPADPKLRAYKLGDEIREPLPYHPRNKMIVLACNVFLGMPKSSQQIGGTWYTIKFFRTVLEGEFKKPNCPPRVGMVIMPNGDVGHIKVEKRR